RRAQAAAWPASYGSPSLLLWAPDVSRAASWPWGSALGGRLRCALFRRGGRLRGFRLCLGFGGLLLVVVGLPARLGRLRLCRRLAARRFLAAPLGDALLQQADRVVDGEGGRVGAFRHRGVDLVPAHVGAVLAVEHLDLAAAARMLAEVLEHGL